MQETAHHRDQPDKDREYLRPPRAPQVPFAAATAHDHAQARIGLWSPAPAARACTKTLRKHSPATKRQGTPAPCQRIFRPSAAAGGLLRRSSSGPGTCSSHYRSARAKTPSAWSARHIREARRCICRAHNWTICCIPRDQSSTLAGQPQSATSAVSAGLAAEPAPGPPLRWPPGCSFRAVSRGGSRRLSATTTLVPDDGCRLLLGEPGAGGERLIEPGCAQPLAGLGHQIGLDPPQMRPCPQADPPA